MRRLRVPALALLVGASLAGCAGRGSRVDPAPVGGATEEEPYSTCRVAEPGPAGDVDRCLRTVEAGLLVESGGRARRAGSRLVIRGGDSLLADFEDRDSEGDDLVRYRYGGWLAAVTQHVVLVDLYEGAGVLAVDGRTGRVAELLGRPVASPDGARLAAANADLVAAYTESGLQIWRVTSAGLELEWALDGGGRWGGSDPRWRSVDRLTFTFLTVDPATMEPRSRAATLELGRDGFALRLDR